MKEITVDKDLVAHCGLYCGACGAYLKDGFAAFMAEQKRQSLPRRRAKA